MRSLAKAPQHRRRTLLTGGSLIAAAGVGMAVGSVLSSPDDEQRAVEPSASVCVESVGQPGEYALLNITPVEATGPGFVTARPSGEPKVELSTSSANFNQGTVDPNVTLVRIGDDRKICIDNSQHNTVDIIVDQIATLDADVVSEVRDRLLDTREPSVSLDPSTICLAPGASRTVQLANQSNEIVRFGLWSTVRTDGVVVGQAQLDSTEPRFVDLAPGSAVTIPPIADEELPSGDTADLGVKAPINEGTYIVSDFVRGVDSLSLQLEVSAACI